MRALVLALAGCIAHVPVGTKGMHLHYDASTTIVQQRDRRAIFAQIALSSVRIRDWTGEGAGSGTIVSVTKEWIDVLTCAHVVVGQTQLHVDFDLDGFPLVSLMGIPTRVDDLNDLALVRVANNNFPFKPLAVAATDPEVYEELYSVSAPVKLMRCPAVQILAAKDAVSKEGRALWSFTGMSIPGMSGGALTNANGAIVCVTRLVVANGHTQFNQLGACVPTPSIRQFLARGD